MGVPLRQSLQVGTYMAKQKLHGNDKYPLIVELEPLFACNLSCNGCGKIQYPTEILRKRLTVDQAVDAIEESGAPMVSIAGGEPLLHPDIDKIVAALLARKKFVYLCTNALLLERKLDKFKPNARFSWVVHIDGLKERHYLMADGYAETYKELLETTDWEKYGRGKDPRCANCMAHCGYEPSAVMATTKSFKQSIRAAVGS